MQKPRLPLHAIHAESLDGGQGEAQEFVRDIDAGRDEGDCVCSMSEQGLDGNVRGLRSRSLRSKTDYQ